MVLTQGVFIGVDLLAARKPVTYAVLDVEQHLLALGQGRMRDLLAFLAGRGSCAIAVSAPRRAGIDNVREEALSRMGIPAPQSAVGEASAPAWMRRGFELYAQLGGLDFLPYPAAGAERVFLETDGEMTYWMLLGHQPYPARTLEGRLQRQFVLYQRGVKVVDPMDFLEEITPRKLLQNRLPLDLIYSAHELNAWAAALTAWMAVKRPAEVVCLGEGDYPLVLPVAAA